MKTETKVELGALACGITMVFIAIHMSGFDSQPIDADPPSIVEVDNTPDILRLLRAICEEESGGDLRAVGDKNMKEWSRGPYCITEPYWIDGVEQLRREGEKSLADSLKYMRDVWTMDNSEIIIKAYWRRYAPDGATAEQLSRLHNGGPTGHKKTSTLAYWKRIQTIMIKQRKEDE